MVINSDKHALESSEGFHGEGWHTKPKESFQVVIHFVFIRTFNPNTTYSIALS